MLLDDFFRQGRNLCRLVQAQDFPRLAEANLSVCQILHRFFRQSQQTHVVRHRLSRHSNPRANLLLGQIKFFAQQPESFRLFQTIQVLSLQVFDDGHLGGLLLGDPPHDRRHRFFSRHLRRPAAPLAQNQYIAPCFFRRTHHHGLHHSIHANGIGQLLEQLLIKQIPRLIRILVNMIKGDVAHHIRRHTPRLHLRNHSTRGLVWGGHCGPPDSFVLNRCFGMTCRPRLRITSNHRCRRSLRRRPAARAHSLSPVIPNEVRNPMVRRSPAGMNRSFNSDTSRTTRIHSSRSTTCDHPRAGKQRFQPAPQGAPLLGFFLVLGSIRRLFPQSTNPAAHLLSRSRSRSSHSVRSLQANHFDAHRGTARLSDSAILSEAKDLCHPRNLHRLH